MTERQTFSIDQIKAMLLARLDEVVHRYAPPGKGSYEAFGKYFTLNPGRSDRTVGSFYVYMGGPKAGQWCDHAMPSKRSEGWGDIIDLIGLACFCDTAGALIEARAFLGLHTLSAEDLRGREQAAARAAEQRRAAEANEREKTKRRASQAQALFLSAQERLRDTPVHHYLMGARHVDLAALGRQPRAIRYLPECFYRHIDQATGEVIEGKWPAMVALVNNRRGEAVALHRTYLERGPAGQWRKATLPDAKKVLGSYRGGWINIWTGHGPRGGKARSITVDQNARHVFVAEGIEDALSGAILLPNERFIAAISLSNIGALDLPPWVESVTLIADRDENATAQAQLANAVRQHQAAGRRVRMYQNTGGGKDLNDALRAAAADEKRGAA